MIDGRRQDIDMSQHLCRGVKRSDVNGRLPRCSNSLSLRTGLSRQDSLVVTWKSFAMIETKLYRRGRPVPLAPVFWRVDPNLT
jgi:hypothetical protein